MQNSTEISKGVCFGPYGHQANCLCISQSSRYGVAHETNNFSCQTTVTFDSQKKKEKKQANSDIDD
jgi:hypothetical protein